MQCIYSWRLYIQIWQYLSLVAEIKHEICAQMKIILEIYFMALFDLLDNTTNNKLVGDQVKK